jgi:hypothetical protein
MPFLLTASDPTPVEKQKEQGDQYGIRCAPQRGLKCNVLAARFRSSSRQYFATRDSKHSFIV